jgi:exodeoxyribonuclease VII large subunit
VQPQEIFTVSGLTSAIKKKLETAFTVVSVRGEVSNLRKQASGHVYFTLKDKDAQISSVLFRGNARFLKKELAEGDQILATGELSVYAPRGNYQIIIREVEFSGEGELLRRLQFLKESLQKRGWFEQSLKKPLPKIPKTIGVVTSPTGSVIQDIIHVLSRRFSGFHLILNPVRVQGAGAASEIARAIEEFNRHNLADVLIIGRGGGSLEDLWPFNEEIVAKAIFESKIPVVSAVGHETDFTISDFVADVRAPTPSAAAEIVSSEKRQMLQDLTSAQTRLLHTLSGQVRSAKKLLETLARRPPLSSPYALLEPYMQKMDEMKLDLQQAATGTIQLHRMRLEGLAKQKEMLRPQTQIAQLKEQFSKKERSLHWAMQGQIKRRKDHLDQLSAHLKAIDPRNLLKKGYSVLFRENSDSVILSTKDVSANENLRIQLSDGQLKVKVEDEGRKNV